MKYLIISDIHGNYENLEQTLAMFRQAADCSIACLGDLVGEADARNSEVIRALARLNIPVVLGGHDEQCFKVNEPQVPEEDRSFLSSLPIEHRAGDMLFTHDNPLPRAKKGEGMWRSGSYIWSMDEAIFVFGDIREVGDDARLFFVGHTHVPKVFSEEGELEITYETPIVLDRSKKYIINPGAMGGSIRKGFADRLFCVYDVDRSGVTFHRISSQGH